MLEELRVVMRDRIGGRFQDILSWLALHLFKVVIRCSVNVWYGHVKNEKAGLANTLHSGQFVSLFLEHISTTYQLRIFNITLDHS